MTSRTVVHTPAQSALPMWLIIAACIAAGVAVLANAAPAHAASIRPSPPQPRITGASATAVSMRWRSISQAAEYRIYRDGTAIARTKMNRFTDRGLRPGSHHQYTVSARRGGSWSARSAPQPVALRARSTCDYVADPGGSNAATGRPGDPFRTAARLVDELGPGITGCLSGTHSGGLTIRASGSRTQPTVLMSVPGQRARLNGRLWVSQQAHDVIIQNLNLNGRNAGELPSPTINGARISFLRNDVTTRRSGICFVLGSVRGFGIATKTVLDGNRIHDCGKRPANNHQHGVYLENSRGARITNNVIFDNADRGIQLYPNARGTLVSHNIIDGNGQGVIFSGNHGLASTGNRVIDNIISNSRLRYNVEHWWPAGNPVGSRNTVTRNCLWNGRQGNVLTPTTGYRAFRNRNVPPRFRARGRDDYRVRGTSRCRNLVSSTTPVRSFR